MYDILRIVKETYDYVLFYYKWLFEAIKSSWLNQ